MFWLKVATGCYVAVNGHISYTNRPMDMRFPENYVCIQTVQISTMPVVANLDETVYQTIPSGQFKIVIEGVSGGGCDCPDAMRCNKRHRGESKGYVTEDVQITTESLKESEERDRIYRQKQSLPYRDLK